MRERSKAMEPFVEDLFAWEVPTMAEKVAIGVSFSAAAAKTISISIVSRPHFD